jgi:hypothetical protein
VRPNSYARTTRYRERHDLKIVGFIASEPFVPLFPIGEFTKRSKCPHHGPFQPGSRFVCMVCHKSAWDWHPDLKRPAGLSKTRKKYRPGKHRGGLGKAS